MSEARYVPNGELQGDASGMSDHGNSKVGDYSKSLGDAKRSDLDKGYCDKGSMTDTGSDKGFA